MSKRRMSQEKARVVLEFLNTSASAAELCRKHNISPATFQDWKDKFMAGGKQALAGRGDTAKIHTKEVENFKRIIGEITVANDILKKLERPQNNEDKGSQRCRRIHEPKQGAAVLRGIQMRLALHQKIQGNPHKCQRHLQGATDSIRASHVRNQEDRCRSPKRPACPPTAKKYSGYIGK